jgi:hypothetical protein
MYIIAFTAMVLFAGARSRFVGTDAGYYVNMFNRTYSFNDVINGGLEPGYFLLCWLAHIFSDNYFSIFTLVAMTAVLCFAWVIRTYSMNETISFFVLLVGGYYTIAFNGFRQGIANAIFFLSIGAIFRRNFILYASCVAGAMIFHESAIFALPAYFLITRKNNVKLNLLIVILGGVSAFFFDHLIGLVGIIVPRYRGYGQTAGEGLGLMSMAFMVALCSFFFFFKTRIIKHREMYDSLLNMFLLATTIAVVAALQATNASGIRRLAMYFSISAILLWPIVYANILEKQEKMLFMFCFAASYLLYYGLTLQAFSNLVPYTFNPVIIAWLTKII